MVDVKRIKAYELSWDPVGRDGVVQIDYEFEGKPDKTIVLTSPEDALVALTILAGPAPQLRDGKLISTGKRTVG